MRNFFLRTTKKSGEATLFFQIRSKKHGLNMNHVNTGVQVNISKWLSAQADEDARDDYRQTTEGKKVYSRLRAIDEAITNLLECSEVTKKDVEAIMTEFKTETKNNADRAKKTRQTQNKASEKKEILVYLRHFIDGIKKGEILTGQERTYTKGTIQNYIGLERYLKSFLADCPHLRFDDLTSELSAEFRLFLRNNNLMPQTVNRLIGNMKALVNSAADNKALTDFSVTRLWKKSKVLDEEKKKAIYLTDTEINALANMELTDADELKARDLFIFGYALGQRFSDYSDITPDDIAEFDGEIILDRTQKKTRSNVTVMVSDSRAIAILKKYDNTLPTMEHTKFNRIIKSLFSRLRFIVPSLSEMVTTTISGREKTSEEYFSRLIDKKERGEKFTEAEERAYYFAIEKQKIYGGSGVQIYRRDVKGRIVKPKWTLVGSHTPRRSFVTNEIKKDNLSNDEIMTITGHTSEKMLNEYNKIRRYEQAVNIGRKRRAATDRDNDNGTQIKHIN